ncbi:MAG: redoxin domain protein, partial [Proteobacteria bacterium]|nr:redoxin domain protein [Pseudomonadota bacterium]
YAPRGLKVIGVAMDYDIPSQVKAVVEGMQIPYPVALDARGDHAKAFDGVELVPYSLLIAADGHIVLRKLGLLDMAEIRARIEELLTEV